MKTLLRNAKIVDSESDYNGKTKDILIEGGKIISIGTAIKADKNMQVVEAENLHVSIGWFDMQANFCDPGFEYKESITSGAKAAENGGFTGVSVMSSTNPPLHSKSQVEYIKNKAKGLAVDVHPIGTVSHKLEGKQLSEMYDMHLSGAVAFSDDKHAIEDAGLLLRALLYAKNFNGLILTHCCDDSIAADGQMNEGAVGTSLGLKGIPALAEELMIVRNIHLAEYAETKIHISSVSTEKSVELIRAAKAKGLKITASVNAHHLFLNDSSLSDFDTNYKVNPPLRIQKDIDALKKGLSDGTIDVIVSDHVPENKENKKTEFDHAAFGMIGLETAFAIANTSKGNMKLEKLIHKISIAPRKILNLEIPSIKEGAKANLTLFNPDLSWTFTEKNIFSKSKNTPFIGTKLKGKAIGIFNNNLLVLNTDSEK
ncbi:MAG: dihydroorotase [Bacteroidia bacterium]